MNFLLKKILLFNIIIVLFNFHNGLLLSNGNNTTELDQKTGNHDVLIHDDNNKSSEMSISSKILIGIRRKLLNTVSEIIQDIVNQTDVHKLKQCYNSEFAGKELNLFRIPLKDVITKYFVSIELN